VKIRKEIMKPKTRFSQFSNLLRVCVLVLACLVSGSQMKNKTKDVKTLPLASPNPSFWNDLSRKRPKGGIDVSQHSKESRSK